MSKSIYDLNLHEGVTYDDEGIAVAVQRVPGGWTYLHHYRGAVAATFVPWSNEFQHKNNPDESRRRGDNDESA